MPSNVLHLHPLSSLFISLLSRLDSQHIERRNLTMASFALASSTIAASSFCGQKVNVKTSLPTSRRSTLRLAAPRAKYGDESVYFDLKDVKNTTGAWDLYGQDGPAPYNGLQVQTGQGKGHRRTGGFGALIIRRSNRVSIHPLPRTSVILPTAHWVSFI